MNRFVAGLFGTTFLTGMTAVADAAVVRESDLPTSFSDSFSTSTLLTPDVLRVIDDVLEVPTGPDYFRFTGYNKLLPFTFRLTTSRVETCDLRTEGDCAPFGFSSSGSSSASEGGSVGLYFGFGSSSSASSGGSETVILGLASPGFGSSSSSSSGRSNLIAFGIDPVNALPSYAGTPEQVVGTEGFSILGVGSEGGSEGASEGAAFPFDFGPILTFYNEFGDILEEFVLPSGNTFEIRGYGLPSDKITFSIDFDFPYVLEANVPATAAISEPAAAAALGAGLAGLAVLRRRRRNSGLAGS